MKLRDANLQLHEKNSFTYPPSSSSITITFSKEALKVCEQNIFQEYKQKIQ